MRKLYGYTTSESREVGCPFCGGDNTTFTPAGEYGLHKFYCNDCKVEFTIDERIYDEEAWEVRNLSIEQAFDRWETRSVDASEDECPFCGEKIQEWPYGHYLFDSLWCANCKKRYEFQSHPHSKNSMRRTMREFGKRAKKSLTKGNDFC